MYVPPIDGSLILAWKAIPETNMLYNVTCIIEKKNQNIKTYNEILHWEVTKCQYH